MRTKKGQTFEEFGSAKDCRNGINMWKSREELLCGKYLLNKFWNFI